MVGVKKWNGEVGWDGKCLLVLKDVVGCGCLSSILIILTESCIIEVTDSSYMLKHLFLNLSVYLRSHICNVLVIVMFPLFANGNT